MPSNNVCYIGGDFPLLFAQCVFQKCKAQKMFVLFMDLVKILDPATPEKIPYGQVTLGKDKKGDHFLEKSESMAFLTEFLHATGPNIGNGMPGYAYYIVQSSPPNFTVLKKAVEGKVVSAYSGQMNQTLQNRGFLFFYRDYSTSPLKLHSTFDLTAPKKAESLQAERAYQRCAFRRSYGENP